MAGNDPSPSPWMHEFRKASGRSEEDPPLPPLGQDERRLDPRFRLFNVPARLTLKGRSSLLGLRRTEASAVALDLSEGGARIAGPLEVPEGSSVELQIDFVKFKDRISSDGVVAWCRVDPADPSRYKIGIMFVGLQPSVRKKIGSIRQWFTSDYCSEYREVKPPSDKSIAVPADPRGAPARDPLSVQAEELVPGLWALTVKGFLEGPDFDPLEKVLIHALQRRATGLLIDLKAARARSPRGLEFFLSMVDQAGHLGAKSLFVSVPPALKELFDQRTDRKRNFVPDIAIGKSLLLAARRPPPPG